jgi:hypothetical protein
MRHLARIRFMHTRAPAVPLAILSHKLQLTAMNARDIHAVLHDSEFEQISDRHSQTLYLKQFTADQCFLSINDKALACIYEISIGNVKEMHCIARQSEQAGTG